MSGQRHEGRAGGDHWSRGEVNEAAFKDVRLGRRFGDLPSCLSDRMGGTIPLACQDWASTRAACRFFSNPQVEEGEILAGHFAATSARYAACEGPVPVLQDTTEFTYQRRHPGEVGVTKAVNAGRATRRAGFATMRCAGSSCTRPWP